jgi:hypothetical protein
MTTAERPLFHTKGDTRPRAPSKDTRYEKVTLYDRAGNPHEVNRLNAREALEKSGWTTDPVEGEKRRANPLPPIIHTNQELGPNGRTPRHTTRRAFNPITGRVESFPVEAELPTPNPAA